MRRRLRVLPALWLLALLLVPIAGWLLGARQPLLQNRPKTAFPAITDHSIRDGNTFAALDGAILDRLPFRGTALDVRTRVALDVFHDSTNPDIAVGDGGWLYFKPELKPCEPGGQPSSDPADAYEVLARAFVAAGYRTSVIAVGSKLFVHTRDAPQLDAATSACVAALERRIADRLAQTPGGLTIDDRLRAIEATGAPTFLRLDSHWNWRGRLVFARETLDRMRSGLAEEVGLHAGPEYDRPGDLAALLGVRRTERDRLLLTRRAPQPPLRPGGVVLIGDSQLENTLLGLGRADNSARLLADQPWCRWPDLAAGVCDDALRSADAVLIEQVARDMVFFTTQCFHPLGIAAERMDGWRPAGWEQLDGGSRRLDDPLTIPASGLATVRFRLAEDRADTPRLLRLTVERTIPQADGSPTPITATQRASSFVSPCMTPAQTGAGALLVPVPAGARVSDLVVELRSAAGSRLGRPQQLVLDGGARAARR
ncbi:MAG TPA: hypothetical protein VFG31_04815 [Conexibacter sp.]|nr:hypothetical protein [Conexibacter sp.]